MGALGLVTAKWDVRAGRYLEAGHAMQAGGDVKVGENLYVDGDLYVRGKIHRNWTEEVGRDNTEDARIFCESVAPGGWHVADCMWYILEKKRSEAANPRILLS